MGNGDYRGISNTPPYGYWADTIADEEREAEAQREYQQMVCGICSVPDCDEPIAGYCAAHHSAKLCSHHLSLHLADHAAAFLPGRRLCRIQSYPGAGWGVR